MYILHLKYVEPNDVFPYKLCIYYILSMLNLMMHFHINSLYITPKYVEPNDVFPYKFSIYYTLSMLNLMMHFHINSLYITP